MYCLNCGFILVLALYGLQSHHAVLCFLFFPAVATSLTMISTEKTSTTGKKKDGARSIEALLFPAISS